MQDHFELNVSVNGRHLFATAPRSFTNMTDAGAEAAQMCAVQLQAGLSGQYEGEVKVTVTRVVHHIAVECTIA